MDATTRFARLEDRVRGELYDLTDGADWPSLPDEIESALDEMDDKARASEIDGALHDWRAEIVKAAVAEMVDLIGQSDAGWVEILAGVLDEDTDPIVTQLECDDALSDHDDVMLMELADPYHPREHAEYEVRTREDEMDDMMLPIRDALARKLDVGHGSIEVRQVDGYETCPLVSIVLPLSDARELAK